MPRTPPREDRRVIAISMLPKAYTEIQRLRGQETWTKYIILCVLAKEGDNPILFDELKSLLKVEKPEPKAKKPKKAAKSTGEQEPTGAELKAIEAEATPQG